MELDDRWVRLTSKLIELTRQKKLTWEGPDDGTVTDTGRKFKQFFAHYQDKYFRVRKNYGDFIRASKTGGEIRSAGETKYFLAIMDEDKNMLYSIPETAAFEELFEAVIFQKAGIDKLLDDLLKDP